MSTLSEIEKAADALPAAEQETLLRHLSRKVARRDAAAPGWPVPPPDVPRDELRRIHALIEEEFSSADAQV